MLKTIDKALQFTWHCYVRHPKKKVIDKALQFKPKKNLPTFTSANQTRAVMQPPPKPSRAVAISLRLIGCGQTTPNMQFDGRNHYISLI